MIAESYMKVLHGFRSWGLSDTHQGVLLFVLTSKAAPMMKEVKEWLGISAPAVMAAVDFLEERGYVMRERRCSDRRAVWLRLTTAGTEVLGELIERRKEGHRR